MTSIFSPLTLRSVTFPNRLVVTPMCQYSAKGGVATDYHLVHLGRFALGGFGTVIVEATAVVPEGRITYADLGLWSDDQVAPLARIVDLLHTQGAVAGIQLAHAGRKAASPVPWRKGFDETEEEKPLVGYEDWRPVAPSAVSHAPDSPDYKVPHALTAPELDALRDAFVAAARRAEAAGFDIVEVHSAHGYLLHQFLSPIANQREDEWGGNLENRMRFPLSVAKAVREAWPAHKPMFVRISAQDGLAGGWTVEDSVAYARALKEVGADLIDCSSGGFTGGQFAVGPAYQVPLARRVREGSGLPTMAVGLVTGAREAEAVVAEGSADLVALGRAALDDPNWPLHAQHELAASEDAYARWPLPSGYAVRNMDRALQRRGFVKAG